MAKRFHFLTFDQQLRLRQLTNTGQLRHVYTSNPEDRPGKDRHVVELRDPRTGAVLQDKPLTTAGFQALIDSTAPACPDAATLDGSATYHQVRRTGELLEYFEVVSFDLRSTCPTADGRQLDTWDLRRARFADKWDELDATDRRLRLAEARAVLFEYHGTDIEHERHVVPDLAELAGREHLSPTVISNSVRR